MKNSGIALGLMIAVAAQAAAPTVEEVGDPDSFGRDVLYLGNAQTSNVALLFTTVSKTAFRIWESIRWPSASTTSL